VDLNKSRLKIFNFTTKLNLDKMSNPLYTVGFMLLIITLIVILSQFIDTDKAGYIIWGIVIFILSIYGLFSIRRNIAILKEYKNDRPQDLIINGIRFSSTIKTNAALKLVFFIFFYSAIGFFIYLTQFS